MCDIGGVNNCFMNIIVNNKFTNIQVALMNFFDLQNYFIIMSNYSLN